MTQSQVQTQQRKPEVIKSAWPRSPRTMRGTSYRYPVNEVMISTLVNSHGVTWAGWFSQRKLEEYYDAANAAFFMNRNSRRFWRQWDLDSRRRGISPTPVALPR